MLDWLRARVCVAACLLAMAPLATAVAGDLPPPAPKPAEIMPDASQSLLLDVVDTGSRLVAVGGRGDILLSDDGDHWQQVAVPVRATLTSVYFVDADEGWAVGHDTTVLHTTDGGQTWTLQNYQPALEQPLLDVLFLDKQHGFATGAYGLFLRTSDGGDHWTPVTAPAILADGLHLYSIRRLGNGDLFIAGEQGLVGLSTDGGQTWTKLDTGYAGTFFSAAAVGNDGAIVCGLRGHVFYAADVRAPQWQTIDTGRFESIFGCTPDGSGHVVMGGVNGALLQVDLPALKVTRLDSGLDTPISAVLPWKGRYIVVGDAGVHAVAR